MRIPGVRADVRRREAGLAVASEVSSLQLFRGSGRRSTPSTTEKTAVVEPIPNASVSTAIAAKPGDLRSWRSAIFESERTIGMKPHYSRRVLRGTCPAKAKHSSEAQP